MKEKKKLGSGLSNVSKASAVGAWLITSGYCGAAPRCVCVSVVISVYVWLIIVRVCASVCAS